MTKLEQHLSEIGESLSLGLIHPVSVLVHLLYKLEKTLHLAEDLGVDEYYESVEELYTIMCCIPLNLVFDEKQALILESFLVSLSWDNYITEDGEYMPLGSVFYNKLENIKTNSSNEHLISFAIQYGGDLLINLLNELEVICK